MDILLYVTELLQRRKAVGIAGLGTLYKKKSPGKYDVEKHAFVPPSYTLAFTTAIEEQETLAQLIHEKRNISLTAANYYIQEFVEKIQAQLAADGQANLEPIGQFKLIHNEITFLPDQESNFGFEFYGLPAVDDLKATTVATHVGVDAVTVPEEVQHGATPATQHIEEDQAQNLPVSEDESTAEAQEATATQIQQAELEAIVEENRLEEENPDQEIIADAKATVAENEEILNPVSETIPVTEQDEQPTYDEIGEFTAPAPTPTYVAAPIEDAEAEMAKVEAVNEEVPTPLSPKPFTPDYNYADDDEEEKTPNRTLRVLIKTLVVLLIIVALGAIAYYIFPQFFDKQFRRDFNAHPSEAVTVPLKDTTDFNLDSANIMEGVGQHNDLVDLAKDTTKVATQPKQVDQPAKTQAVATQGQEVHEVIGSAERNQKRIDYVISTMKKHGIEAKPIKNNTGSLTLISLGTFTDYNLAKTYRDSLRIKLKNPQIYIQSIKPKR